jgi:hypothetical protein
MVAQKLDLSQEAISMFSLWIAIPELGILEFQYISFNDQLDLYSMSA